MKKIVYRVCILLFFLTVAAHAQLPPTEFRLNIDSLPDANLTSTYFKDAANNLNQTVINAEKRIVYSVWLKNTFSDTLLFTGGQVFLDFNKAVLNGGTGVLNLEASSLPGNAPHTGMWLSNPTVFLSTTPAQLRCASSHLGDTNIFRIPPQDSILWGRFKLVTSAAAFSNDMLNLVIRVASHGGLYVKYGALVGEQRLSIQDAGKYKITFDGIMAPSALRFVAPTANDELIVGNSYPISWTALALVGDLKISMSADNGTSWSIIENNYPAANRGAIVTIPETVNGSTVQFKLNPVISSNGGINSNSYALISNPVKNVRITQPSATLRSSPNSIQQIEWNTTGAVDSIGLEYSIDKGITWTSIVNRINAAVGVYQWTVPDVPSDDCRIRIFTVKQKSIADICDYPIIIKASSPLPVELTTFTAERMQRNVLLQWKTGSENNSKGFVIERLDVKNNQTSTNSIWQQLGFIESAGNSVEPKSYLFRDENVKYGKYEYRLLLQDFDGSTQYSHTIKLDLGQPEQFILYQNYPNPFNPTTKIEYEIPVSGEVSIILYDVLGRKIRDLVNGKSEPGWYSVELKADGLSSGVYFYVLKCSGYSKTMKLMIMK